ncbi:MAG TPA: LON peptidase substrate-binding domain-containing protein [Phycisphaerae bacterium]|nr:LON peptidase substrate-binding domain-containing protein [Phycisphaerae bacterium]
MTPCKCPEWVPLFPLPNAVLLPGVVLPLHVFEPRYRIMTAEALATHRMIAIALLKPGFEEKYHTLAAEVHPMACVGKIMREERLPDGRFNFLLQGRSRARILGEDTALEYRRVKLQLIRPSPAQPDAECALRRRLRALLCSEPIKSMAREENWPGLLACENYTLSDVVDIIAASLLPRSADRQCFLTETCVATRTHCICDVLESIAARGLSRRENCRKPGWPPLVHDN